MKASSALIILSFLAVGYAFTLTHSKYESYSAVEDAMRKALEKMRPNLVNPKIDDFSIKVRHQMMNMTYNLTHVTAKHLDKFVIAGLKGTDNPLSLTNLTLTLKEVDYRFKYDINGTFSYIQKPLPLWGKGDGSAALFDVRFTIGAHLEMKDKVVQIKPKGLFGFDVAVKTSNFTLSSLMGSENDAKHLSELFGLIFPLLVEDFNKPVFDLFQDKIIDGINKALRQRTFENQDSFEIDLSSINSQLNIEEYQPREFDLNNFRL